MARPIVLSNGELHVGINKFGLVHDFYYPYVGLENHVAGRSLRHKVGVWADGAVSWLDEDDGWTFKTRYPNKTLVGQTIATNQRIGVVLEFEDVVDSGQSAFLRNIQVINLFDRPRDIRLFLHQAFAIGDSRSNTDTAQYLPKEHAVLHYRGRRAFVISGWTDDVRYQSFDQYTVGLFGIENHEGSYRDADDGELSSCNVEHGKVDSVLRFSLDIKASSSARVHYWIAAGTSTREALYIHSRIKKDGLLGRLQKTADWWSDWISPALPYAKHLPEEYQDSFLRSVMIIKSQIDKRGAVIASTDTTMLNYARDAYAYCWPRDGALVLWPLIRMGFKDEPYRFFEFCRRGLHDDGYLMHKYRADGALGSSWHPYVQDGQPTLPIQEDETALTLFTFCQFYEKDHDLKLMVEFYSSMVVPMASFLAEYIDSSTSLPQPSYDLWEERFLTTTFSTSVTYAALLGAAELAELAHDTDNSVKWRLAAEEIQAGAKKYLFNDERKSFNKGISFKDGQPIVDDTIDISSFFGVFMFGLFPIDDETVQQTFQTIQDRFELGDESHGVPRYENDEYHRRSPDSLPNHWVITTLWLAQYQLERGEREAALKIIDWVSSKASPTGMLPEQLDPDSGQHVSVEPLTWSHAEYVSTLLDTLAREKS